MHSWPGVQDSRRWKAPIGWRLLAPTSRRRTLVEPVAEPCVLIADPDRTVTSLVHAGLAGNGLRILEVHDGEAVLTALGTERPAVLVLSATLPGRSGLEITRLVRADPEWAALPIVLLSQRADANDRIAAIELGADDYIVKPFHPREVAARVKALIRRRDLDGAAPPPTALRVGDLTIDVNRYEAMLAGRPLALTRTEFRLLFTLMEQPGRAFQRAELVDRAMGDGFNGSVRTLDSHMRNLRAKIETDSRRPRYIQTVFGVGYRLIAPRAD